MSLSLGIVGLPNVGKSTLFNALLKKQVALSANYPFATIEPNVGVTEVPDSRLEKIAEIVETDTVKHALVEFFDIAGLIKGAAEGEGLGNQFLSHIRETDAICHVLRAFSDSNVVREGAVSPKEDLNTIRTELQLADLETLQKQRKPKGVRDAKQLQRWDLIRDFITQLEQGKNVINWQVKNLESGKNYNKQQQQRLALATELNLLTFKPELFVINVDEQDLTQTAELRTDYARKLSTSLQIVRPKQVVIISAKIESELAVLSERDQQLYMDEIGIERSGLTRLAEVAYQTLGLQSFVTAGQKEVRAWTIKQGATACQAAGQIHTDFQRNFIKARVVDYQDFIQYGGWVGVKERGKMRLEGRNYVMQPNDIVEFMVGS